jgi:hypothetical protein
MRRWPPPYPRTHISITTQALLFHKRRPFPRTHLNKRMCSPASPKHPPIHPSDIQSTSIPPSDDLSETQRKYQHTYRGLMCSCGLILQHPAADQVLEYASKGSSVDSGEPWTLFMSKAATIRVAHPSAREATASKSHSTPRTSSRRSSKRLYARLIAGSKFKANLPGDSTKLPPFAVTPHKSRLFCSVLYDPGPVLWRARRINHPYLSHREATTAYVMNRSPPHPCVY